MTDRAEEVLFSLRVVRFYARAVIFRKRIGVRTANSFRLTEIISEIDKKSGEHDGVTILGGEPFDQTESLEILVEKLKAKNYHLTIYSGFTLESLLARESKASIEF